MRKSLSAVSPQTLARTLLVRSTGCFLLWWILSEGDFRSLWFGALAVTAAVVISFYLAPIATTPLRLARLPGFVLFFVWQSILGGVRVSLAAFSCRPPMAPGFIECNLTLPSGGSRVLLVNALSLMPGTLGVELDGTRLRIHVLDQEAGITADILSLQRRIGLLFEVAS